MKFFNRLVRDKRGFTLMEAVVATSLVAIAASMSVGVFVSSQKINANQYAVNNGQNSAMASAEDTLSMGSVASPGDGEAFEMTPASGGSNGFNTLEDNGKVSARCQSVANDKAEYKVFKLDAASDEGSSQPPSDGESEEE